MRNLIRAIMLLFVPAFMAGAVGSWNGIGFTALNGVAQTSWNGTGISCASGGAVLTYRSNSNDGTDLTIYTFTGLSIGAVADRDAVIYAVYGRCIGANGATITSTTAGGIPATQLVLRTANDGANSSVVALFSAVVPSGTTGDFIVTFSTGMTAAAVSVQTIKGAASLTPTTTVNGFNASGGGINLNTTAPSGNSAIIGAVLYSFGSDVTMNWSGLSASDDMFWDTNRNASSANATFTTSGSKTISCNPSSGPGVIIGVTACFQ